MQSFRPILPLPGAPPNDEDAPGQAWPRRKRSAVTVACNTCRTKKSACDGKRPACTPCSARGVTCVYLSANPKETHAMATKRENEYLKKSHSNLVDILDLLRNASEDRAITILKELRMTSTDLDPAALLSTLKGTTPITPGLRPLQILAHPPAQDSLEFELMIRHAVAYPTLVPLDTAAIGVASLATACLKDRLGSEADVIFIPLQPNHSTSTPVANSSGAGSSASSGSPTYCDPRLALLKVSNWSWIEITDELAARLISFYLETDHPVLGLFDADLFVLDLINNNSRFCSPLLVSVLLFWACRGYRTFDPKAAAMGDAFFEEANVLWEQERRKDSLPTIAAAQLLGVASIYNGDDGGFPYIRDGAEMAQRMGLFGTPASAAAPKEMDDVGKRDWLRASSHTAWGVFNWVTMRSYMFQEAERLVKSPPTTDPPGAGSQSRVDEAITDGMPSHNLPEYMGRTFPAMCQFWVLTSQWISVYYRTDNSPVLDGLSVQLAERTFEKLIAWADGLHKTLARGDQSSHHSIILHIWYHASILQLFRPFLQRLARPVLGTSSASVTNSAEAEAIFAASLRQLKHLVIVFRVTYPCRYYAIFWHVALLQVANAVLRNPEDPEWRIYLELCLDGYADLYGSFRVAGAIAQALLSIALSLGVIPGAEAKALLSRVLCRATHSIDKISATVIIDLDLAVAHRNAAQLETLIGNFDELTLFDEFITIPGAAVPAEALFPAAKGETAL